jgi:hypothetical protein
MCIELRTKATDYIPVHVYSSVYNFFLGKKKIPVFPLTCSKILGSVGRKKILFFKISLASFYRGHILTLIVLVQKCPKKNLGRNKKLGSVVFLAETHVILFFYLTKLDL